MTGPLLIAAVVLLTFALDLRRMTPWATPWPT